MFGWFSKKYSKDELPPSERGKLIEKIIEHALCSKDFIDVYVYTL